jgi:hypothetical protein
MISLNICMHFVRKIYGLKGNVYRENSRIVYVSNPLAFSNFLRLIKALCSSPSDTVLSQLSVCAQFRSVCLNFHQTYIAYILAN